MGVEWEFILKRGTEYHSEVWSEFIRKRQQLCIDKQIAHLAKISKIDMQKKIEDAYMKNVG